MVKIGAYCTMNYLNKSVTYFKTVSGNNKIPFYGVVIYVDKDGCYCNVRNQIGDIDYIETLTLKIKP